MQNPKDEVTFVMIKPDGVKKGLVGEIIKRIEQRGLKIVRLEMIEPTRDEIVKLFWIHLFSLGDSFDPARHLLKDTTLLTCNA